MLPMLRPFDLNDNIQTAIKQSELVPLLLMAVHCQRGFELKINYVLIDYENVPVKSLALLKDERFRVKVFLGPKNTKLPVELVLAVQELGSQAEYIILESPGQNALDFHIAYYLGDLTAIDPMGYFHIISGDKGFDSLIRHLKTRKISVARSSSIEKMPCFDQAAADSVDADEICDDDEANQSCTRATLDDMIKVVIEDLIKRKTAKPRTQRTLRNTLQTKLGRNVRATDVDAVYAALLERNHVKADGTKVTYTLPAT